MKTFVIRRAEPILVVSDEKVGSTIKERNELKRRILKADRDALWVWFVDENMPKAASKYLNDLANKE